MKKVIALVSSLLLVVTFATPAQSAGAKYSVYQKTLATFSSSATTLTTQQKAQVKATVEANPTAEKFICTGIRYYDQPMSVNITVRKRAKASCEYAKQLNPALSTWFQNKPTKARSYAGKVLLTVKSPKIQAEYEISQLGEDPEICKLQEDSRIRYPGMANPEFASQIEILGKYKGNATSFPFAPTSLNAQGEITVQMVMVDWVDLQGNSEDYEFYQLNADLLSEFYFMASEGKLKVNVSLNPEWLRIPGSYKDLAMTVEEEGQRFNARPKKQDLYDAVVEVSDSLIDYTNVDVVLPAWPRGKTVSEQGPHEFNFNWNAAMYTDEGTIYNIAGAGDWFINHTEYSAGPWIYYVHEMGHMMGIQHIPNGDLGDDAPRWLTNPIDGFDIMGNQDGAVKTISSWLRWLAGWLDDDQVVCITEESITDEYFQLQPLNDISGQVEALVIKLSDTKAVVVESRRFDERFDRKIPHSRDGLVVYTVDATKAEAQGSMVLLSPRDITKFVEVKHWRSAQELDANFCQGDSVDVSWLRIEAVAIQDGGDYVRISKTDKWVDPEPPQNGPAGMVDTVQVSDGCVVARPFG
jgi:M6 family metalloprotease-like protein